MSFPAWEETAVYVDADCSRSVAITWARDEYPLCDYHRVDLHAVRVWMRKVEGDEAQEFFDGEFDSGWAEVNYRPLNDAQKKNLVRMWKVKPK